MNIYISADMEGLTGVTVFEEIKGNEPDYSRFKKIVIDYSKSPPYSAIWFEPG